MRIALLTTILIFLTIGGYNNGLKAQSKENEHQEVLDKATFRVVYKVDERVLKEGDPFVITDTMALDIGQTWSVYYDFNLAYKDSVRRDNFINNSPRELLRHFGSSQDKLQERLESKQDIYSMEDLRTNGEYARIYKNISENEILTIDNGPQEFPDIATLLRFTEQIKPMEWIITEDTMTILDYPCQKATTSFRGRDYYAWFTLDIAVNEGPWKLYGLPGLILKAEDSESVFSFHAIGLQELSGTFVDINPVTKTYIKHRDITITTVKQFRQADIKKWLSFRQAELKRVNIKFVDWDAVVSYFMKNPIVYQDKEIYF